jgi:hypothetical protein
MEHSVNDPFERMAEDSRRESELFNMFTRGHREERYRYAPFRRQLAVATLGVTPDHDAELAEQWVRAGDRDRVYAATLQTIRMSRMLGKIEGGRYERDWFKDPAHQATMERLRLFNHNDNHRGNDR